MVQRQFVKPLPHQRRSQFVIHQGIGFGGGLIVPVQAGEVIDRVQAVALLARGDMPPRLAQLAVIVAAVPDDAAVSIGQRLRMDVAEPVFVHPQFPSLISARRFRVTDIFKWRSANFDKALTGLDSPTFR